MRLRLGIVALLCARSPYSAAQVTGLMQAVEALSPCALQCLMGSLSHSACGLADTTCMCTNAQFQTSVESCITTKCTIKEGLTAQNVTSTTCNKTPRDRSEELRVMNIGLMVVSAFFIVVRIGYKILGSAEANLGLDDYFIMTTLLFGQPNTIIIARGLLPNGLGRDIWTLDFHQITAFGKYFYWVEILYFAQISLLKLSFLFFYKRIFPGRTIQRLIWFTIAFNVLYGIAFVIVGVFQCRPISYYWTTWDGEHSGRCVDINAIVWANAAISIAVDLWMLAIPLSQLIHLKLSWSKKLGVIIMFCLGTFATVVSIIRLQFLITFARTKNPTWDQWNITKWSAIELTVGIVCACIPSVRMVLARLMPGTFGSAHDTDRRDRYQGSGKITSNNTFVVRGSSRVNQDTKTIHCTKTFTIDQGKKDDDEVELVRVP